MTLVMLVITHLMLSRILFFLLLLLLLLTYNLSNTLSFGKVSLSSFEKKRPVMTMFDLVYPINFMAPFENSIQFT